MRAGAIAVLFLSLTAGSRAERSAPAGAAESVQTDIDPALAREMVPGWQRACEQNDGLACGNLGALYVHGKGVPQSFTKGVELYERACRFGQGARCLRAGVLVLNGKGVEPSATKAAELFVLGCRLAIDDSCVNYYAVTHGLKILLDGSSAPLPPDAGAPKAAFADLAQAGSVLMQSCFRGEAKACGNLGGFYEEGDAFPHDLRNALLYYEKACGLGEWERCARAGRYHANGKGTERDALRASELFEKFCAGKGMAQCPLAKRARAGLPIELRLAVPPEHPASGAPARAAAAPRPWVAENLPLPLDGVGGEELELAQLCNRGDARACGNAGARLLDEEGRPKEHPARARRYFEKACALGRAQRCLDLARFFEEGWGGERSGERQRAAIRHACSLGHKASCEPR